MHTVCLSNEKALLNYLAGQAPPQLGLYTGRQACRRGRGLPSSVCSVLFAFSVRFAFIGFPQCSLYRTARQNAITERTPFRTPSIQHTQAHDDHLAPPLLLAALHTRFRTVRQTTTWPPLICFHFGLLNLCNSAAICPRTRQGFNLWALVFFKFPNQSLQFDA